MEDSLRFSETGAAFWKDMFSKHAMHANLSENVVLAGEFLACEDRLIFDNNSGTYAPPKELLKPLVSLFSVSFARLG